MRANRFEVVRLLTAGSALLLLLAACGGEPPTAEEGQAADTGAPATDAPDSDATGSDATGGDAAGGDGDGDANPEAQAALDEVYAAVEGLTGEERREKLLELAEAEGSTVSFYTTFSLEEAEPVIAEYEDVTGMTVNLYRAPSSSFMQRLLLEADADYSGADVVSSNGTEMVILEKEGLLAPLDTPVDDDLPESFAQSDLWAVNYLNVFTPAWNTDLVQTPPTTWEETLQAENLSMEITDAAWFMELVTYFQDQGMSEEEAIALFEEAGQRAFPVDGHTAQNELLAAGQFGVAAATYMHRSQQFVDEGAPVAWEPAIEPMIASPNGIGIHRDVTNPANSLLFLEYLVDDSQELMGELGRTPVNPDALGGTGDYEVIVLDTRRYSDERQKWDDLYQGIVGEPTGPNG